MYEERGKALACQDPSRERLRINEYSCHQKECKGKWVQSTNPPNTRWEFFVPIQENVNQNPGDFLLAWSICKQVAKIPLWILEEIPGDTVVIRVLIFDRLDLAVIQVEDHCIRITQQ
jgi:hypothetical protein